MEKGYRRTKMAEWISVKDKMPEDGKEVLFSDGISMIAYAQDVTHWMPLPEPPEEEDKNG